MTIPATTLVKLGTLSLSAEDAAVVASMLAEVEAATKADAEAAIEASRAKARERVARWRDNHPRNVTERNATSRNGSRERAHTEDKPLPSENYQQEENKKALRAEFDEVFWPEYPHKVGKPKAWLEFQAARKRAELSTIIDGLRRYIASKPPDRAWLNPATFLHQERFNDQPAVVVPMARAGPRRNGLMDLLNASDAVPRNDHPEPAETAVFDLPASAYR